ncbi:hypothetical protein CHS0354_005043 [Potamilus streckersoni]|uniref:Uncharacterized protein n=1 Tax=Potamilus streckersoni TaxID=2493646 RepID=A0AAE0SGZ5_9BIVA|nr:hypothetical protein CHS0354_005043 [Potamilus streckersoni]
MTTPTINPDFLYPVTSKQVLVTRDPVFVRQGVINGHYIGRMPNNYLIVALIMCVINPVLGPIGLIFSIMSERSYRNGDLKYAEKWAMYSFSCSMMTFIASVIIYIAIGFTLSPYRFKGSSSY